MSTEEQTFTDRYLKFTQLYTRTQVEEELEERIPEKVIRCVWNDQSIKTDELKITDGRALEVIFPGYWNFGSGPGDGPERVEIRQNAAGQFSLPTDRRSQPPDRPALGYRPVRRHPGMPVIDPSHRAGERIYWGHPEQSHAFFLPGSERLLGLALHSGW